MIETLLKKAHECIKKAHGAESKNDKNGAKKHYLRASKFLFDIAGKSHGQIKTLRVENAEMLLRKANSIKKNVDAVSRTNRKNNKLDISNDDKIDCDDLISSHKSEITFNDVAGLEKVKEEIRLKLIYPFEHKDEAIKYGLRSGGGILLYGPPGTGKTLIAKAVAGEITADFFSIKPSSLMDQFVGNTEKKIANLFSMARECERAVIFIDEIESLMPKRHGQKSTIMSRVVPQFLTELDGADASNKNILILGATNEPWSLDSAALRPGRFDEKIYVHPPDFIARKTIFELNLKKRPLSSMINFNMLAERTENYNGADISYICDKAAGIPFKEFIDTGIEREITMDDLIQVILKTGRSLDKKVIDSYEQYFKDHGPSPQ